MGEESCSATHGKTLRFAQGARDALRRPVVISTFDRWGWVSSHHGCGFELLHQRLKKIAFGDNPDDAVLGIHHR